MICAVTVDSYLGRSQTWIDSQEVQSLARSRKLDGALAPRASLRLKVTRVTQTRLKRLSSSSRKHSGLLPLVRLALSGPEETLQWLLSQLVRYSFCGICRNTGVVTLRRNVLVLCLYPSYCGQKYIQGCAEALRR